MRAVFTFWTGAKFVWWLLITSVQCIVSLVYITEFVGMLKFHLKIGQCIYWNYSGTESYHRAVERLMENVTVYVRYPIRSYHRARRVITCITSFGPQQEISNNVLCTTSKDSDQPAHMRSLIRAFASRLNILWMLSYWPNRESALAQW